MSQSNAEKWELVSGATKLKINEEAEEDDRAVEIDSQKGSEVKGCGAEKISNGSKIVEEGAEIEVDDVKEDQDEAEAYIQFIFDPEVILNEYPQVIAEIAKYLDYQDYKSLRRVNKLWSAGVTPKLVQNSVMSLNFRKLDLKELEAFGGESEKENLRGLKFNTLKINLMFSRFENKGKVFQAILSKLAPSLTALELHHWFDDDFFIIDGSPISLPALTTLTLKNAYLSSDGEIRERRFFQFLYPSAPNIAQLVLQNVRLDPLSSLLADDGCRNWSLAPKLNSLVINCSISFENQSSAFWHPLFNFPQPWQSLDIAITPFNDGDLGALFGWLEKNKDTLVKLKLEIDGTQLYYQNPLPTLRFPSIFSKLEKLELDFVLCHCNINFGGSELNFSQTMPNLGSLSVKLPRRVEAAIEIWASLFPPQVFRGLTFLKVEGIWEAEFGLGIAREWAPQSMFPNARIEIA